MSCFVESTNPLTSPSTCSSQITMSTTKRPKSKVWDHFEPPTTANPMVSTCKHCNKHLSYKSTSTSAMARHLKSQHNICIDGHETSGQSSTSNQSNEQFSRKQSINSASEAIVRCALDGMSIKTILNSEILKDYLDKVQNHSQMPKSEEEFKELIVQFHNQAIDEYRNMFEHFKSKGTRFSVSFSYGDEFRVHCNVDSKIETFHLEMYCQRDELDETLRIFGLDLNSDIIAVTCDDDGVKLSKGTIVQFCMKDVFESAVWNLNNDITWLYDLYEFFRSSTHNLNVLQKYIDVGDGEKIDFVFCGFDCISIARRAEQLLKLQPYIKDAFGSGELQFYKYYRKSEVYYDKHNFGALQCLVRILKPLVEAQEELDKPNSNLLTAEVVMKYVFMKLRQIDWDISRKLIDELIDSLKRYRNPNIVSLMYFLKHRKYPMEGFESIGYSSKDEIIETANELNQRFFPEKNLNQHIPITNSPNSSNISTLIDFLNSEMCDTVQDVHLDGDLTSHFELAQKTKTLTPQLEKLYNALMSIRPSVIKLQTKLFGWSDDQIDKERELYKELNFFKHYFIRKDAKQINQKKRPIDQ